MILQRAAICDASTVAYIHTLDTSLPFLGCTEQITSAPEIIRHTLSTSKPIQNAFDPSSLARLFRGAGNPTNKDIHIDATIAFRQLDQIGTHPYTPATVCTVNGNFGFEY